MPSFVKLSYLICIPLVLLISITIVSFDYLYANEFLIYVFSLLFLPLHIINYYNNSIHKSKKTTQSFLFSSIISAFLKLTVIYYDLGLKLIIVSYLIDTILFGFFLVLNSKFNFTIFYKARVKPLKVLKKSIIYNITIALSFIIYTRIDQLMIKFFLGDFDLGVFGAMIRIYDAYVMIGFTLTLSLLSYFTSNKKSILFFKKIYKYFYLLFIPSSVILFFLSESIIKLLYGINFVSGINSLKLLFVAAFFAIFTSLNNKVLIVSDLERTILIRVLICVVINIILNSCLIPVYGITGAALSTLFITVFSAVIFDLFNKKSFFLNRYKF